MRPVFDDQPGASLATSSMGRPVAAELGPLFQDVGRALRPRVLVFALDEEPVLVLVARFLMHPDEMPPAVELLPMKLELEMSLGEALVRIADRRPCAAIPHKHRAAAVFALGDRAFERAVVERMVLDFDREPLLAGDEARAARHRPALQHAVELQPKIVMEPPRVVLLHDEAVAAPGLRGDLRPRLRGGGKVALGAILLERHPSSPPSCAGSPSRRTRGAPGASSSAPGPTAPSGRDPRFRAAPPSGRQRAGASAASAPRWRGPRASP